MNDAGRRSDCRNGVRLGLKSLRWPQASSRFSGWPGISCGLHRPTASYQRIDTIAADEKPERLVDAEDDIHQFLARFPDDPRVPKLKNYLEEIDLLHLERRLQRLPRQLAAGDSASPIERDYLEAIGLAGTAPQRAAAKLQAIVDVYGSMPNPPETITQFVELTRRKLNQLREQSQREAPDYLAAIDRQSARGRAISSHRSGQGAGDLVRDRRAIRRQALGRRACGPCGKLHSGRQMTSRKP